MPILICGIIYMGNNGRLYMKWRPLIMAAPVHPDKAKIKTAMRQLWWNPIDPKNRVGKLPSRESMKELFEKTDSKRVGREIEYSGVLKVRSSVSRKVIGDCRDEVKTEFAIGKGIVDRKFLETWRVPKIKMDTITTQPPNYANEAELFDDTKAELLILNSICQRLFGHNIPVVSYKMALKLRNSLTGLDPAVKLFLLLEFSIRQGIHILTANNNLKRTDLNEFAKTVDLEKLIALKMWQSKSDINSKENNPFDDNGMYKLQTWILFLEPLCFPEWKEVRDWYLLSLRGGIPKHFGTWNWKKILLWQENLLLRNDAKINIEIPEEKMIKKEKNIEGVQPVRNEDLSAHIRRYQTGGVINLPAVNTEIIEDNIPEKGEKKES